MRVILIGYVRAFFDVCRYLRLGHEFCGLYVLACIFVGLWFTL